MLRCARALGRPVVRGLHGPPPEVELTSVRYPTLRRGQYARLRRRHIDYFEGLLGKQRVLCDPSDVDPYNVDWIRMVRGAGEVVLKPRTTEEVSRILGYCNGERLAVCPQGGNTGLVGGSVPVFDEVILSTALMNTIVGLDEDSGVLVCQAGCVLEALDAYLSERGFVMPLDLGAKGSCHIGGNVATNAGGIRLLRYGSLHGTVLGVEAVTADGRVVDCLSTLKKDNTGYHLKHLFIGSEGTLGVITKVAVHCPPRPAATNVAFLGLRSFNDVLGTARAARHGLGEILSSCEMMDADTMDAVTTNLELSNPVGEHPFYMLLETAGSNGRHDDEKMAEFLERSMASGLVQDGTLTSEPSRVQSLWALRERAAEALQLDGHLYSYDVSLPLHCFCQVVAGAARRLAGTSVHLWQLRERVAEGLVHDGYVYKYDISLPLSSFYAVVPMMTERLAGSAYVRCCGYGHVGDGNLHLNITSREFDHGLLDLIEPFVYEWTSRLRGSVSAEHGIGLKKTAFLHLSKSAECLALMRGLKQMLDPNGILNPYKVLPPSP